jgi:hypothetical protein
MSGARVAAVVAPEPVQAAAPGAGGHAPKRVRRRLSLGAVTDPLEHQADAAASRVIGMGGDPSARPRAGVPRPWARERHDSAGEAPAIVDDVLRRPGKPLDDDSRAFFEPRFGCDFSQVRVHDDASAARSAQAIAASAYTVGRHIVLADPRAADRGLLAHELAHVVQQRGAPQPWVQRQPAPTTPPTTSSTTPVTPPSPPTRAPNKREQDTIEAARAAAAIRTQTAYMRTGGVVPPGPSGKNERSPEAQMLARARRLAQRMFDWENPNMEQVSQVLGDMVTRLTSPEVRIAGGGDPQCGTRAAYVVGLRPPIVLCPTFFSDTAEQRVRTMIHEAAHLARIGSGTIGESYCVVFDCEGSCGGFDSADGWAHYVHCLSDQPADKQDTVEVEVPGAAEAREAEKRKQEEAKKQDRAKKLASIADRVYDAMEGLGTDEEGVYRALQELDRDQDLINELMTVYKQRHKADLLDDIKDDFSGTELEFALQLLNLGTSDKPQSIDDALFLRPQEAAQRIRDAVEGPGTDEEAIYAALLPFRRNTLDLQRAYQEAYHEDLRDRIDDEMSGSQLRYALDLMETPMERYMQEASAWLKRYPAVGFGLPWKSKDWYDTRFWDVVYDSKSKEYMLKLVSGTPHDAIDALFHEQGRWHVDCAVFVDVVQLYALRQSLGAKRFDARIGSDMRLRAHGSTGMQRRALFQRSAASAPFSVAGKGPLTEGGDEASVLAQAPIGSRVRWTSQLLLDKGNNLFGPEVFTIDQQSWPYYEHENTIKLGPDAYGAQGVGGGGRVSRKHIEDELVDVTAGQFPKKTEAEIRAGIYVSEIEVFEQPDVAEQIEPEAKDSEKGPRP